MDAADPNTPYLLMIDEFRERRLALRELFTRYCTGPGGTDAVEGFHLLQGALVDYIAAGHFRIYPACLHSREDGEHACLLRQVHGLICMNTDQLLLWHSALERHMASIRGRKLPVVLRKVCSIVSVRFALEEQLLELGRPVKNRRGRRFSPDRFAADRSGDALAKREAPAVNRPVRSDRYVRDSAHRHVYRPLSPILH